MAQPTPAYHVEREPAAGGAELVTVFGKQYQSSGQSLDVPLLSVLRDTLGSSDPASDRLRYVWILTSTRPSPWQRFVSAVSFAYFRAGSKQHADRVPAPVLDLAAPSKTVWPNLLGDGVQALQLDPMGWTVRSSTRSYRGNSSDYHKVQVFQALSSLQTLSSSPDSQRPLSDSDLRELYSRLSLSNRTFGGLVSEESLPRFYDQQTTQKEQNRGHNWELLRQRAELNGLYFEPLALPDGTPNEALLWIARADLDRREERHFSRQFLNIADPWSDKRLLHWTGYSQTFYFDAENRPVAPGAPGAQAVEMIPLALYSLDYPLVPLLLVDFRNTSQPKRRELVRHGATTILAGILGIARFSNWPYLAANSTYTFVRGRLGSAVNRSARLEAYSGARAFLAADSALDPKLRSELWRRLDSLALNPLENRNTKEATFAREQYAALLQYATSPTGLEAKLDRERQRELDSYTRSSTSRLLADFGRFFTRSHDDSQKDLALRARLDIYRRGSSEARFLNQLLTSSPRPEVNWDAHEIRNSIDALSVDSEVVRRAPVLVAQVFERSQDTELREACIRALGRMEMEEARNQLRRISQDPKTADPWRSLALLYLGVNVATGPVEGTNVQSGTQ